MLTHSTHLLNKLKCGHAVPVSTKFNIPCLEWSLMTSQDGEISKTLSCTVMVYYHCLWVENELECVLTTKIEQFLWNVSESAAQNVHVFKNWTINGFVFDVLPRIKFSQINRSPKMPNVMFYYQGATLTTHPFDKHGKSIVFVCHIIINGGKRPHCIYC